MIKKTNLRGKFRCRRVGDVDDVGDVVDVDDIGLKLYRFQEY
jgi:hypothetical protein